MKLLTLLAKKATSLYDSNIETLENLNLKPNTLPGVLF